VFAKSSVFLSKRLRETSPTIISARTWSCGLGILGKLMEWLDRTVDYHSIPSLLPEDEPIENLPKLELGRLQDLRNDIRGCKRIEVFLELRDLRFCHGLDATMRLYAHEEKRPFHVIQFLIHPDDGAHSRPRIRLISHQRT
jgi:hypothetical protein